MQGSFCILEFIGMQEMTEMERSEIEVKLAFAVIRRGEANYSIQESLQACLQGSYCMLEFIGMQEMTEMERSGGKERHGKYRRIRNKKSRVDQTKFALNFV